MYKPRLLPYGKFIAVSKAVSLASFLLWAPPIAAEEPGADCLECHSDRDLSVKLEGGEDLSLYVDPEEWRLSPHAAGGCAGCHGDVDIDRHPEGRTPAAGSGYGAYWSKRCRACHGKEGESIPVHEVMLAEAAAPACSLCHAPHRMKRVREWKPKVSASVYCLTCHQQKMRISLVGGETLSLTIREAALGASVHLDHDCTDCHGTFSKLEHPLGVITSAKDLKKSGYELCRGCHEEYYTLFEGTTHFKMMTIGHRDAPVCTDCHGYHAVAPVKSFELLSGIPCRRCHGEVFEAFRRGVHRGKPRFAAHTDVPVCVNCHRSHDADFTPVRELVNETCLGCHGEVERGHGAWLAEAASHFESVACTACHTPAAERAFAVRIFDSEAKDYVDFASVRTSADPDLAALLAGAGVGSKDLSFWGDVISSMNRREGRGRARFHIRLESRSDSAAHEIGQWEDAHRKCEGCHEGDLKYLERVFPQSIR